MKTVICTFLLLLISVQLSAQNCICGFIGDEQGQPLSGASIFLPEMNKGTISDGEGAFCLKGLPDGKARIQISYLGYRTHLETLTLTGPEVSLSVYLSPTPIEAEEIVISGGYQATQHENAMKIDLVKPLPKAVGISPNFTEMITSLPGVNMISKGPGVSKPVIRGLSMNDILVLNNNVRFENYQYSDHHPLGISEFGIEDIEIIKGPASLLYGSDAIGGVINFIREKPAPVGTVSGDYNLQLFSNSMGMVNNLGFRGTSERFFGGLRAGYKTHADYLQGGGDFLPNSRFNEWSLKGMAGYTTRKGAFRIYYDYTDQQLGLAEEEAIGEIRERGRKTEVWFQHFQNQTLSSQNRLFLGRSRLDVNAAIQTTNLAHITEQAVTEIQMKLSTLTYDGRLTVPFGQNYETIFGFQGLNQRNKNVNDRPEMLLPDAITYNYSLYLLAQRIFAERGTLQAGLRYDLKGIRSDPRPDSLTDTTVDRDYSSFSGSAGGTWRITPELLIRGNLAMAYRTPNLAELTSDGLHETRYEIGNPGLVSQKAYESDLGLHFHTDNLTADLAGFFNYIRDYIYIAPTGDTTVNGEDIYEYTQTDARLFGGEASLHFHPRHMEWLHVEAGYSMVRGMQATGDYLPFIPADHMNIELMGELKRLFFFRDAYLKFATHIALPQDRPAPEEEATDGYTLLNTGLGALIPAGRQKVSIDFTINNLFDKKYTDHLSTLKEVGLNNPGRNFILSMKIPFGIFN